VDAEAKWLLTAYNIPSTMSVHPLGPDSAISERSGDSQHRRRHLRASDQDDAVQQALVLVTRSTRDRREGEDRGALRVKAQKNGQLTDIASIAPGAGCGFGRGMSTPHQAVDSCRWNGRPTRCTPAR
jgi:hypothetical protein